MSTKSHKPDTASDLALARSMRKLCKGAFGDMDIDGWNHRVIGTGGSTK